MNKSFKIMMVFMVSILYIFAATGCKNKQQAEPKAESATSSSQLQLAFQVNPTHPAPHKEATLSASVKAGSEVVKNAKVELEVWKKGNEKHDMLPAKLDNSGFYSTKKHFMEDGEYLVVVHVTTPEVHQMISSKFNVGNASASSHGQHHDMKHDMKGENPLAVHAMVPEKAIKHKSTPITTHIHLKGQPVKGASVEFEYWVDPNKHEKKVLKEQKPGEYQLPVHFCKPGKYSAVFHVKSGDHHTCKKVNFIVE